MPLDVFLQEHGKTIFIAVCILLLVGVAYAVDVLVFTAFVNFFYHFLFYIGQNE